MLRTHHQDQNQARRLEMDSGPYLYGEFNIYPYDCCNPTVDEPCKTLEGRYWTYYYDGLIAFVEY